MRVLACVVALTLWSGCADLDNIDVDVSTQVVIAGKSPVELFLSDFPAMEAFTQFDLTQTSEFQNSEYSPDDVDSVFLTRWVMSVVDPVEGQDLSFFGSVTFFIETEGLPRIELARQDSFPSGVTVVAFERSEVDLQNYLLARQATVTAEIRDSSKPDRETTVKLEAVFDVDISIL